VTAHFQQGTLFSLWTFSILGGAFRGFDKTLLKGMIGEEARY
jgi:hypothetical protein